MPFHFPEASHYQRAIFPFRDQTTSSGRTYFPNHRAIPLSEGCDLTTVVASLKTLSANDSRVKTRFREHLRDPADCFSPAGQQSVPVRKGNRQHFGGFANRQNAQIRSLVAFLLGRRVDGVFPLQQIVFLQSPAGRECARAVSLKKLKERCFRAFCDRRLHILEDRRLRVVEQAALRQRQCGGTRFGDALHRKREIAEKNKGALFGGGADQSKSRTAPF